MAAKSTAWTFAGFYVVILLYLLVCGQGGVMVDAADAGTDYLDRKESYVKDIAKRATQNQEACVCHPSSGTKTTQCTPVDNNEFCGTGGNATSCKYMLLDYTRSFVTLPPPGDIANYNPRLKGTFAYKEDWNRPS